MQQDKNKLPNWTLFLFFGALGAGLIYGVFLHLFLRYDAQYSYRLAAGELYVQPQLTLAPPRSAAAIKRGTNTYERICVACHGSYGQYKAALSGPDLSDNQWLHNNNEKSMMRLVRQGIGAGKSITGQVMPARAGAALSDTAIWEVIYYISERNKSVAKDAKPGR